MAENPVSPASSVAGGGARLARFGPGYAALTGLTSLAILLQGVFAGEFIQRGPHGSWLDAHSVNGDVATGLAVISAIYAGVLLRGAARSLLIGSTVLAVLMIVQSSIGHAITDSSDDGLIPLHVPLALLVFGLTIWLSVRARGLRKAAAG